MQNQNSFENPTDILYGSKRKEEKEQNNLRNSLLNELGDNLSPAQILYSSVDDLKKMKEQKSKTNFKGSPTGLGVSVDGKITGGASSIKSTTNSATGDFGFDKSPLNLKYYYELSNEYDKELGDFLHKNTSNPDYYGNDLRHQYVSAIFARNLGQKATTILGNLNEMKDLRSQPGDSEIDQINNEIGRSYAKRYPDISRQELLKLMLKEHPKNQQIRIQKMKEKNKRNLDREYM